MFVNLFIASELQWSEKGLRIRQETSVPEQGKTTLTIGVEKPVVLSLNLRVPYWATRGGTVKLNGRPLETFARPSSYFTMRRTWKDGDRVEVDMPMSLHAHPMPDDETLQAIMYGPVVLVGELGTEGLTREQMYGRPPDGHDVQGTPVTAPYFVSESDDLNTWIEPVASKPLTFRTTGQVKNITFTPLNQLFGQRYATYWRVYRKASEEHRNRLAEDAVRKATLARTVDHVTIGEAGSESDHNLQGKHTQAGNHLDRSWRHATPGGWFSYDLKVVADQTTVLVCTYWGSDTGRTFDILIDGTKIATQTLKLNKPDEFFNVEYKIPDEIIQGKQRVTVRFQGHPGNMSGGVFGCATMKPQAG